MKNDLKKIQYMHYSNVKFRRLWTWDKFWFLTEKANQMWKNRPVWSIAN